MRRQAPDDLFGRKAGGSNATTWISNARIPSGWRFGSENGPDSPLRLAEAGVAKGSKRFARDFEVSARSMAKTTKRFAGQAWARLNGPKLGPPRGVPKSVLKLGAASVEAEPFATKRN